MPTALCRYRPCRRRFAYVLWGGRPWYCSLQCALADKRQQPQPTERTLKEG